MFPAFNQVEFRSQPFEHFIGYAGSSPAQLTRWLDWLETKAPWKLTVAEFYEQYEFSLLHAEHDPAIRHLATADTLVALRMHMSECFHRPLSERVDVVAHRLVPGQTIRIHNDYISGGETHRLLLQINRGWAPAHGGYLMLFNGPEPGTVSRIIEPQNGSVQAFAISPESYHAVSTVHAGHRFTIVYSFYSEAPINTVMT